MPVVQLGRDVQERDGPIGGDCVQDPRRRNEALQRLRQRRDDDADLRRERPRPRNFRHHGHGPTAASPEKAAPRSIGDVHTTWSVLEILSVGNRAPHDHVTRVHAQAQRDRREGTPRDGLGRIFQSVRPVCASQDSGEAREEDGQHVGEGDAVGVCRRPVILQCLRRQAGHRRRSSGQRRGDETRVVRGQGKAHHRREEYPELRYQLHTSPHHDGEPDE